LTSRLDSRWLDRQRSLGEVDSQRLDAFEAAQGARIGDVDDGVLIAASLAPADGAVALRIECEDDPAGIGIDRHPIAGLRQESRRFELAALDPDAWIAAFVAGEPGGGDRIRVHQNSPG